MNERRGEARALRERRLPGFVMSWCLCDFVVVTGWVWGICVYLRDLRFLLGGWVALRSLRSLRFETGEWTGLVPLVSWW